MKYLKLLNFSTKITPVSVEASRDALTVQGLANVVGDL